MLMLPPVVRVNAADRVADRRKNASASKEAPKAEEATSPRVERVERPYEGPDRRKRERRTPQREAATSKTRAAKPYAPLVAQVIATSLGLSQTRSRRRASVAEALKAYEKDEDPPPETRGLV